MAFAGATGDGGRCDGRDAQAGRILLAEALLHFLREAAFEVLDGSGCDACWLAAARRIPDIHVHPPYFQLATLSRNDCDIIVRQIALRELPTPRGLLIFDDVVLLTPGPFEKCADAAVAVGGRDMADLPSRGTGR